MTNVLYIYIGIAHVLLVYVGLAQARPNYTHFIPNEADAECLEKYAVQCMMEFLVKNFTSLKSLSHLVPPRQSPHPIQKSTVVPMKVLFRDEKHTAETIEILAQLAHDASLMGQSPQVNSNKNCAHII